MRRAGTSRQADRTSLGSPHRPRRRSVGVAARSQRPRHDRLPRGRERLLRGVVRRPRRPGRDDLRRDQVAHPGDRHHRSDQGRRVVVHVAHRGGAQLPDPLPRPLRGRRRRRTCCSTRTSRPKDTTSSRSTPSTSAPTSGCWPGAPTSTASEKYTLRIRDLDTGRRHAPTSSTTSPGAARRGRPTTRQLFYVTANEAMRPYRVWRHELGTDQADDTLVFEEPDERFYVYVELSRSGEWIIIDSRSKTISEVLLIPAERPEAAHRSIARPRADDVEYSVDHWGDRFVILTNLDAEDFRVMTAPLDAPGEWTELVAHEPGRRIVAIEPFDGHLVLHEWSERPAATARAVRRRRRAGLRPRHRAPRGRARRQSRVAQRRRFRYRYQSLTTPMTVYEEHVRSRRADDAEADPGAGRRPVAIHGDARVGDLARRHRVPRRHRPSRRHARRRHGPVSDLRLRQLRVVGAAVVQPGTALAARPWLRVGPGPPTRRRRAGPALVPRRQAAQQAQHVPRHHRRRRARRRRTAGRRRVGSRSAAAAPAACWSARA